MEHQVEEFVEKTPEELLAEKARREERSRIRREEQRRAQELAWREFMRSERRELELRKEGQLSDLLVEPLSGEPSPALKRLVAEDRRQAREGLVALMSGGKVTYKQVEDLSEEDMPARIAANRLRTAWLKELQDGWLARDGNVS